jgi:excisionase family DNA binding protein
MDVYLLQYIIRCTSYDVVCKSAWSPLRPVPECTMLGFDSAPPELQKTAPACRQAPGAALAGAETILTWRPPMLTVRSIRTTRTTTKTEGAMSSVSSRSRSAANKPKTEPLRRAVGRVRSPHPDAAPLLQLGPPGLPLPAPQPLDRQREKTVTVKEAAYRLGKSEDAIYKWLRTGRLKGWQPGGRWCSILVLESSVDRALLYSFSAPVREANRFRLHS